MALFGKDAPAPQAKAPSRSESSSGASGSSFLGPNVVVDGTISGDENVIIEGTIRGKIDLKSDVKVGKSARIEASVHARNVSIEGTVKGDISADNRVELFAGCTVDGNLKAPKIVVAEGAIFRGNVDMGAKKEIKPAEQPKEKV
jgi:cytoskeletal protein CcmA (bactofilin family)